MVFLRTIMGIEFLALVRQGQNKWWRYVLAILVILFFWFFLGSIPYAALAAWAMLSRTPNIRITESGIKGIDSLLSFIALNLSFVALLIGLWLAMRWIHQRKFVTLITPQPAINWRRVGQGFGVWLGLALVLSIIEAILRPGVYQLTFNPARFIPFALVILILTPLQTSAEELLFRGYILQAASLIRGSRVVALTLSSFLFMLGHIANPETADGLLLLLAYYFGFGLFAGIITLRDNRLELALGIHAANNLWSALAANYANSALDTPSIFTVTNIDAVFNLITSIIAAVVFYLVFFWSKNSPPDTVARA